MKHIKWHKDYNIPGHEQNELPRLKKSCNFLFDRLSEHPDQLYDFYMKLGFYVPYLHRYTPENRNELLWAIDATMQCGSINFELAFYQNEPAKMELRDGRSVYFPGVAKKRGGVSALEWVSCMYRAMLLRDTDTIELLCKIPEDLIIQGSIKYDRYNNEYVRFMKSFVQNKTDVGERLVALSEALQPQEILIEDHETVYTFYGATVDLFTELLSNNEVGFNSELEKIILRKKAYCEREQTDNVSHFYSSNVTAVMALAYDQGFKLTVTSDYTPQWLVEGLFEKRSI